VNADRFFVECLDELESRATWESSEYSLLRAAGLLRELLLDELPVVTEVNRERRLPLSFTIRRAPMDSRPGTWWIGGLDPDQPGEGPVEDLNLTNLLRVPLLDLGTDRLTIKDLITLAAMLKGLQPLREAARRDMPADLPAEPDGGRRVTARYTPGLVPDDAKGRTPAEVINLRARFTAPPIEPDPPRIEGGS